MMTGQQDPIGPSENARLSLSHVDILLLRRRAKKEIQSNLRSFPACCRSKLFLSPAKV